VLVSLDVMQHEYRPSPRGKPLHRLLQVHPRIVSARRCGREAFEYRLTIGEKSFPRRAQRSEALDNHVDRKAVQPSRKGRLAAKRAELLPDAYEDVLGQLVGSLWTSHPAGKVVHPAQMGVVNALKSARISLSRKGDVVHQHLIG
jgi:hypothetical protein